MYTLLPLKFLIQNVHTYVFVGLQIMDQRGHAPAGPSYGAALLSRGGLAQPVGVVPRPSSGVVLHSWDIPPINLKQLLQNLR
jgi:hypothetical protein